MKLMIGLTLAIALSVSAPALGHGNTEPQHGGVVQMTGDTLFELVCTPEGVSVYVTDDHEPLAASSATARLTVTADGKTQSFDLLPAEGNRFDAPGLTLAQGAQVGIQVVSKATQARLGTTFTIN